LNRRTFAGFGTQVGPTYESTVTYTWDGGNRLTKIVDSMTGTITRGYDSLDRLTSEQTPQGTVSYTYDAANRRQTMTVAGQTAVNYTFDNANRLTKIAQGNTTVQLGYDNSNRRTSLTLANGIVVSYGYDNASELTGLTYTLNSNTLGNLTYSYGMAGRRTGVGGSYARTGLPNAQATTAYDAANELKTWGTATPTYDANGNVLSDGTNSYVWNARNELTSMNMNAQSFQYDPLGRRVAKTILSATTNYLYDGANPIQELSGTTPTANLLVGGVDEYFQRTDTTGTRNFLSDAIGSTLALADSAGTLQTTYTYEPFGNTTITGSSANTYQYTGRENDGTGVYYYRGRYYSPTVQRFISEDPLGFRGGIDFYSYVGNNPTNLRDAFGLQQGGAGTAPVGVNPPEPGPGEVDQLIEQLEKDLAAESGGAAEGGELGGPAGALAGFDLLLLINDVNGGIQLYNAYFPSPSAAPNPNSSSMVGRRACSSGNWESCEFDHYDSELNLCVYNCDDGSEWAEAPDPLLGCPDRTLRPPGEGQF
jgi:RHS repeat-associated protein